MKRIDVWSAFAALVMLLTLCGFWAEGAALTAARNTPVRTGEIVQLLQGSNVVYAGSMVAISTSTGTAQAAGDTASIVVVGKALATSDNSGSAYDATTTLNVQRGVFGWANVSNVTDTAIGSIAYVVDDQTVSTATNVNSVKAGTIVDVDDDYVWVDSKVQ